MMMQTDITERNLVELASKKNKEAFICMYDKFSAPLYGIIKKFVKDKVLAQDVLVISFERMWQNSNSLLQYEGSLFVWMHNIVRDVAMEMVNQAIKEEGKLQSNKVMNRFLA